MKIKAPNPSISDRLRNRPTTDKSTFAKLTKEQQAEVAEVVTDYLADKLNGASLPDIVKELAKSGIPFTIHMLETYVAKRKAQDRG